jgi:hypothetical protein
MRTAPSVGIGCRTVRELLALFVHKGTGAGRRGRPTVISTASAGGEDLVGWHVNRGWDQAADFFPVSSFATSSTGLTSSPTFSRNSMRRRP